MENIRDLLTQHHFLKGLSDRHCDTLAGCAANMHFNRGAYLLKEGQSARYFFLLRTGKVSLELEAAQRGVIMIQTLDPGDVLGWSWLIPPHKWTFSAKAMEETSALALDGGCLRKKCETDHELGYELIKRFSIVLASRLEWTRIQLLDLYNR
ncbi:MAG: cyclic nucleotide-binding domain-containing protein [Candidatus Omnitrophota bacterium]|nr:cyclic nucleotide-binding domain-containing protein [Candidatus Omnitrophota bacterium]MDZ4242845.1 cyclic nucleotide-binding domain-containing protein [Candidatus Omnitrophota bacterium]